MIVIGSFTLAAAWFISLFGLIAGCWAAKRKNFRLMVSALNSVIVVAVLLGLTLVSLGAQFLSHNYRFAYVWKTSNNQMEPLYLVSAIWGGMDGSMLLWAAMMSLFGAVLMLRRDGIPRDILSWIIPVLSGATNFFISVVLFLTNPFRLIPSEIIPQDGNGLNPLLQNPSMLIHPPMLYAGFTGLVIPFAFCLAALLSGNLSDAWIHSTRRWTLIAWAFLTVGIILGGNWAYIELGWGGFWAWDPVENASFLPWLTATAFLHSVMVQKRRGTLKVWNIVLCTLSYVLTVFGTFLTRSGVVQSVHAFAETDVGWVFLVCIGFIVVLTSALIWLRWNELKPENSIESFFSREAVFLFNNLILVGICFTTMWGVLFPILSEAVTGQQSVVGPPFFNQVNTPLFMALLFFMGVGPTIAWRRSSRAALIRNFARPFLFGSLVTMLCLFLDASRIMPAVMFGLVSFVLGTLAGEIHRAARVRREFTQEGVVESVGKLFLKKPTRYGGHLVHFGVLVMAVSITASSVYKIEKDFTLRLQEKIAVGKFVLLLETLEEQRFENYVALQAGVRVLDAGGETVLGYLKPERRFYALSEVTTTEVAIRMTPTEDLYLALAGLNAQESPDTKLNKMAVSFKVFVNPLQMWLWVGGLIVLVGTLMVLGPPRMKVRSPAQELAEERSKSEQALRIAM